MEKNYRFTISGYVQGVFYRKNVQESAQKHGFSGYVKNMPDGKVEAAVTLEEHRLGEFVEILKTGSELSVVEGINMEKTDEHFEGIFEIRY